MVRESDKDAPGLFAFGGVPGVFDQEEASGQTQETLEGLYLSSGLHGSALGSPGGAGGNCQGQRGLDCTLGPVATTTLRDK